MTSHGIVQEDGFQLMWIGKENIIEIVCIKCSDKVIFMKKIK